MCVKVLTGFCWKQLESHNVRFCRGGVCSSGQQRLSVLHEADVLKCVLCQPTLITHTNSLDNGHTERGHRYKHTDPGKDGEEAESDDGSGSVRTLGQRQLIGGGRLPLIGQKAKANKPQEASKTWRQIEEESEEVMCFIIIMRMCSVLSGLSFCGVSEVAYYYYCCSSSSPQDGLTALQGSK